MIFLVSTFMWCNYRLRCECNAWLSTGYIPPRLPRSPTTRSAKCPRSTQNSDSSASGGPTTGVSRNAHTAPNRRPSTGVVGLTGNAPPGPTAIGVTGAAGTSVTSGTLFAWHKKSFKQMLFAILAFVNEVKGKGALAARREVRGTYKTRWVFQHKLRAAIWTETAHLRTGPPMLGGPGKVVVIDGLWIGGSWRKPNKRDKDVDHRLEENRSDRKRAIVAVREQPRKWSREIGVSLVRTFKDELDAIPWLLTRIIPGTTVHTDAAGWNRLDGRFIWRFVNHRRMYSDKGVSTNAVEWLFNRLRRGVRGHFHRIIGDYFDRHGRKIGDYLARYGQEAAWRDDHRRVSNGAQVEKIISLLMRTPRSPDSFCGYWQRHRKPAP